MIRVYGIPSGDKLFTFSRGIKTTEQYFLNFSNDQCYLMSTSDTGTLHIFQLEDPKYRTSVTQNGIKKSAIEDHTITKTGASKGVGWLSFLVPKTCDDFMSA